MASCMATSTFWPRPVAVLTLSDGTVMAGEPTRSASWTPGPEVLAPLTHEQRATIAANGGLADRTLYRMGNYDR